MALLFSGCDKANEIVSEQGDFTATKTASLHSDSEASFWSLGFSADSKTLAAQNLRREWTSEVPTHIAQLLLYDLEEGQPKFTLTGEPQDAFRVLGPVVASGAVPANDAVAYARWNADMYTFASPDQRKDVLIAAMPSRKIMGTIEFSPSLSYQIAFEEMALSSDGAMFAATRGGNVTALQPLVKSKRVSETGVWEVKTGKRTFFFQHDEGVVDSLAFSWDGTLLAAGIKDLNNAPSAYTRSRGEIRCWKADAWGIQFLTKTNWGSCVAFSPDGQSLVAGTPEGLLHWLDTSSGEIERTVQISTGTPIGVHAIKFSPDGRILGVSTGTWNRGAETGKLLLLDPQNGKVNAVLIEDHPIVVTCLAFSPDSGALAAGTADGVLMLWRINWHKPH